MEKFESQKKLTRKKTYFWRRLDNSRDWIRLQVALNPEPTQLIQVILVLLFFRVVRQCVSFKNVIKDLLDVTSYIQLYLDVQRNV